MRPVDDVIVTTELVLSLALDGLPTSDRALRRFASVNGWPIVYNENGKYLFLIDAIPEPWGSLIRDALGKSKVVPRTTIHLAGEPSAEANNFLPAIQMEARLSIIFEVFRRSIHLDLRDAILTLTKDAENGMLPVHLQRAIQVGVMERGGIRSSKSTLLNYSTIYRWVKNFNKNGITSLYRYTCS